ncbi:MAG: DUF1990 domain-containing protein [Candidatus Acidiferrales bacterium]
MFFLSKPAPDFIRGFLQSQRNQPFSYAHAGSSHDQAPRGYDVDHHRVQLGSGAAVFENARKALQRWKMFDIPWLNLCWPDIPIEANATVAVLASHAGFWSLNACRIVYVMEEHGACERYGFAYGTLPEHGERGEERFTVEFRRDDNSVWYDVYAFSRPTLMARLAYPYSRLLQRRFARDSMNAMKEAVRR